MSFKFTPKTEKQISEESLAPDGIYPFTVAHAEEKLSKKGNPMIEIDLLVYVGDGRREMTDYLMEKMAFKLRHFFANTGLLDAYNTGTIDVRDIEGKEGYVRIGHEAGRPKDDGSGDYPPKNVVKDYVSKPAIDGPQPQRGPTDAQLENRTQGAPDEDVPF